MLNDGFLRLSTILRFHTIHLDDSIQEISHTWAVMVRGRHRIHTVSIRLFSVRFSLRGCSYNYTMYDFDEPSCNVYYLPLRVECVIRTFGGLCAPKGVRNGQVSLCNAPLWHVCSVIEVIRCYPRRFPGGQGRALCLSILRRERVCVCVLDMLLQEGMCAHDLRMDIWWDSVLREKCNV